MMKLAIIGSRTFVDKDFMKSQVMLLLSEFPVTVIVSGEGPGAHALGLEIAAELRVPVEVFPLDWKKHGRAAAFVKNAQIANAADICAAFVDKPLPESKGTAHAVDQFNKKGKQVRVYQNSAEDQAAAK